MVSLAKENLLHEKSKIALSMAGVILAVFLIFATTGLYFGIVTVVENMVLKAGADLWVTSQGSSGSLHSPSLLDSRIGEELKRIDGVKEVVPLIRRPIATNINGEKLLISQSLTISVLGFFIGAGISPPLISFMQYLVPEFVSVITPRMMLWVFFLFVATGLVASFIPIRRLSRIDPATVFKGQ